MAAEEGGGGGGLPGKRTRTARIEGSGQGAAFGAMPFLDVMVAGGGLPAVQAKGAADGSTAMAGGGKHVVKKGETLWEIAKAAYGEGKYWTRIRDANGSVVIGGHLVKVGAELVLPNIELPTLDAMKRDRAVVDLGGLRDLAVGMSDDEYGAFLGGLDEAERHANGQLLQLVELMRSTGKTLEELAADQRKWIELEASRQGKTPGEVVRERVDGDGHGDGDTDPWETLTPEEKAAWHRRFVAVEANIRASAPPDVMATVERVDKETGGAFMWEPAEALRLNAFAFVRDRKLGCGTHFVKAGEEDVRGLWPSIIHELTGHPVYNGSLGSAVIKKAVRGMSKADQETATGGNSLGSGYGYMETEIFAELYEAHHDDERNATDRPFDPSTVVEDDGRTFHRPPDVKRNLEGIRDAFEPDIAKGLVRSLALRVELDGFIKPATKAKFRAVVEDVFGDILPPWSAPSAP